MEDVSNIKNEYLASQAPIKLSKRLSVLRYPGGKTNVIEYLYGHLQKVKCDKLISPFTGGGSFELAMLEAGVVNRLHLNDIDPGVYSLWWVLKHMPFALIDRIKTISPNHQDFFAARDLISNHYSGVDMVDAAWSTLLVNRLAYSGIAKANPLGGKNGSTQKLLSRWNPGDLIKRIERINRLSDRIEITNENAYELIEEEYWSDTSTIFIDPPYVKKGSQLYTYYYQEQDHINLAFLLDSLHHGFPGSDIIVTYDYTEWIEGLYNYPTKIEKIKRRYTA